MLSLHPESKRNRRDLIDDFSHVDGGVNGLLHWAGKWGVLCEFGRKTQQ